MIVKINVTQEHIRDGIKSNCRLCPVALAVQSVVLPSLTVNVRGHIEFIDNVFSGYSLGEAHFTHHVGDIIHDYDQGFSMKPFSFNTFIPKHLIRHDYLMEESNNARS